MSTFTLRAAVDGDAFAAALRRMERCASDDRQTVPILSGVLMRADPAAGLLRLYATDLDRTATVAVPAVIECAGEAVARLEPLAAIMAKRPKDSTAELVGGEATADNDVRLILGNFRARIVGYRAADFPTVADPAPPAFSFTMTARDLVALVADAAKAAKVPGADSKGVQLAFAGDAGGLVALTVTAGHGLAVTQRRYAIGKLTGPDGLRFAPKDGAPIVATFTAGAVKSLADAIDKPRPGENDPLVTVGFAVKDGAVSAMMIEAGGVHVSVKASDPFPDMSALQDAPRVRWIVGDGDSIAAALAGLVAGESGRGKTDYIEARRAVDPDGSEWLELVNDAGAVARVIGSPVFADGCEPVRLPVLAARFLKGGGHVEIQQLAGDMAGRGYLACTFADDPGVTVYLLGRPEAPAERFARVYGEAYQARDGEAMRAAVAAYRGTVGGSRYGVYWTEGQWHKGDAVAMLAAKVRGEAPTLQARAKGADLQGQPGAQYVGFAATGAHRAYANFYRRAEIAWQREAAEAARLARGYDIARDRYGRAVLQPCDDGRAERLAAGIVGKWNIPILLTDLQAERFAALYAGGFDGRQGSEMRYRGRGWNSRGFYPWEVYHPDGLAVPKAKRAKAAAPEAPEIAPESVAEAPAAVIMPGEAPEAASGPEIAPEPAIEAPAPVECEPEAVEAADTVPVEAETPPAPADDLAATVAALLARVAALEAAQQAPAAVAEAEPIPEAGGDIVRVMSEALESMLDQFDHPGLRGLVMGAGRKGWTRDHVEAHAHACRVAVAALALAKTAPSNNAEAEYWRAKAIEAEGRAKAAEELAADWRAEAKRRPSIQERDDLRAAVEELKAANADDRRRLLSACRSVEAERDALAAKRQRTAGRMRAMRRTLAELERINADVVESRREALKALAEEQKRHGEALKARLADQARADAAEREAARLKALGQLSGLRYASPRLVAVGGQLAA